MVTLLAYLLADHLVTHYIYIKKKKKENKK
jgi:hypothetical protein